VSTAPEPFGKDEIAERLAALPGWTRAGNEITRTSSRLYHEWRGLVTSCRRATC
jgi:hypothetical protein